MPERFYILPAETIADGSMGPKYMSWRFDPDPPGFEPHVSMGYGKLNAYLVCANLTPADHATLAGNIDVAAAPENIDAIIGPVAVPIVQNVLEQLHIPADWVDTSYTYRAILRRVAGLFQFAQRHNGLHGEELIPNVAALDLRWNQISAARQTRIQATADSFGYDYSAVTNATLIRQILMILGDQWGAAQFRFYLRGKVDYTL